MCELFWLNRFRLLALCHDAVFLDSKGITTSLLSIALIYKEYAILQCDTALTTLFFIKLLPQDGNRWTPPVD